MAASRRRNFRPSPSNHRKGGTPGWALPPSCGLRLFGDLHRAFRVRTVARQFGERLRIFANRTAIFLAFWGHAVARRTITLFGSGHRYLLPNWSADGAGWLSAY